MDPSGSDVGRSSISPAIGLSGRTSDTLGWRDAPDGLALVQAHYLVRHGERTPVRTRLLDAKPAIPARWSMCHVGEQFRSTVLDTTQSALSSRTIGEPVDILARKGVESVGTDGQTIVPPRAGDCMLGELTDLGRATTNTLGVRLRRLYVERLGLLPRQLHAHDADKVYFRSTNMERTIESLHSVVGGLFPETVLDERSHSDALIPTMLIRNGVTENLLPNTFGCGRLRELDRLFASFAAKVHNPLLAELDDKVSPQIGGVRVRVDGHPRANGILDTVRAAKSHGLPIPSAFEDRAVVDKVEKAVCDEWYTGYRAEDQALREQFRRLSMGRFLIELSDRLNAKAHRPQATPLQMAIYSAHDTSVAGVLSTLDVFDHRWPAFTAAVGVELFRAPSSGGILQKLGLGSDRHYVRMRYGDKELRLPACQAKGDHLPGHQELCTLEAFTRATNAVRHPQGLTWEQECEQGRTTGE